MNKTVLFLASIAMATTAIAQNNESGRSGELVPGPVVIPEEHHETRPFVSDQDEQTQTRDSSVYDDFLIHSSLGVGVDIVNGEDFGFSTILMKENNLRIKFDDTSTEGGTFPANDWSLNANESTSGGESFFEIEDVTGSQVPFRLMAGAPSFSLYVDEYGKLGLGTDNPSVEIEVSDGDTPTLRLNQDGSSGWTAQKWDVAANEANFFIRDVTNGSQLPFRIKPFAPTNSLYITETGFISLGSDDPAVRLDVEGHIALDSTLILTPLDTVPGIFSEGSLMMDANDHVLKYYNGTEWQTISANTDEQDLVSATLTGTVLDIEIENGASVSVDLQPLLADLEARVDALEAAVLGKSSHEFSSARLYQNAPNPYAEYTVIPFYIPETISNARMIISDVHGTPVDEIMIYSRGEGSLEFNQGDLNSGTYFYTLILDGKQLESKVMVKVD